MTENKHLEKFFAVTRTSMYEVVWNGDEKNPKSAVTKVALRSGSSSGVPVGGKLIGHFVVLGDDGMLTMYSADRSAWTSNTSFIAGLFLERDSAEKCLNARGVRFPDPRWKSQTQEVLDRLIRRDHPVFVLPKAISSWEDLAHKPVRPGGVRIRLAMPE